MGLQLRRGIACQHRTLERWSSVCHVKPMPTSTNYLARLLGLFSILVGLAMIARRDEMIAAVDSLIHNPTLLLVIGLMALAIGLAMVLAHNVWSGGMLTVVVTIIGWLIPAAWCCCFCRPQPWRRCSRRCTSPACCTSTPLFRWFWASIWYWRDFVPCHAHGD
jgi:hypothetical protein